MKVLGCSWIIRVVAGASSGAFCPQYEKMCSFCNRIDNGYHYQQQGLGCKMQDTGYRIHGAGRRMQDARHKGFAIVELRFLI